MSYIDKIFTLDDAVDHLTSLKEEGDKIVFTNGCFDLLHKGHITYLEKAKALGNVLVVGLNSDASVKMLKGENRPVKDLDSRIAVLAGLASVDLVIVFEDDTPKQLIEHIKPDILVKGGDYKIEDIVGAKFVLDIGGEVKTIEFVPGYSSSTIIQKMATE